MSTLYRTLVLAAALATTAVLADLGQAAIVKVHQPINAGASSVASGREPVRTINGSGLSDPTIVETGDDIPSPWPTHSSGNSAGWFSDDGSLISDHSITFDLGVSQSVRGIHLWNWNRNGGGKGWSSSNLLSP